MAATSDAISNSFRGKPMNMPAVYYLGETSLPPVPAAQVNTAVTPGVDFLNVVTSNVTGLQVSGLIPNTTPCIARVSVCFPVQGVLQVHRYGTIINSSLQNVFTAVYSCSPDAFPTSPLEMLPPLPNNPNTSTFVVYAIDQNGNQISGVTFKLLASNQSTVLQSATTSATAPVLFTVPIAINDLPLYYIQAGNSSTCTFSNWSSTGFTNPLQPVTAFNPGYGQIVQPWSTLETLNAAVGTTLSANALYTFDVPVDVGQTINFRYSAACTLVTFLPYELDPVIG